MRKTTLMIAAILAIGPLAAKADLISLTVTTTANIPVDTWVDNILVTAGIEMTAGDGSDHANANGTNIFRRLCPRADGDSSASGRDHGPLSRAVFGSRDDLI